MGTKNEHFRSAKVSKTLSTSLKNHHHDPLCICIPKDMQTGIQKCRHGSQCKTLEGSQPAKNRGRRAPHQPIHTSERENARLWHGKTKSWQNVPKSSNNGSPQNAESSDFVKDILKKQTVDANVDKWRVLKMRGRRDRAGGPKLTANTSPSEVQNDAGSITKGCANNSRRR